MLSPELEIDPNVVSLLLFILIALLVRPPLKLIGVALIGGVTFAGLNMASDVVAYSMGWWRFPFISDKYPPLAYYAPALFLYGAGVVGLIGWWLKRKFGSKSAMVFLPFFAIAIGIANPILGWLIKTGIITAWNRDAVSYLATYLSWFLIVLVTYWVVLELEKITGLETISATHYGVAV